MIQLIQEVLFEKNKIFTFCWVPSHIGTKENEQVDTAARDAINNDLISNVKLPRKGIKCVIRERVTNKWELQWDKTQAKKFRNIKNNVRHNRVSANKNRQWERTLTRVRIRHNKLTHGFLIESGHPLSVRTA